MMMYLGLRRGEILGMERSSIWNLTKKNAATAALHTT